MMDCGIYEGKRYFIPFTVISPYLLTTKKTIQKYKLNIGSTDWTWKKFAEISDKFVPGSKDKYFLDYFAFRDILVNSGLTFIDYKNKTSHFNSDEFIELLNDYKSLEAAMAPLEFRQKNDGFPINNYDFSFGIGNIQDITYLFTEFKNEHINDVVLLPLPSYIASEGNFAYPFATIGINSKCKYPQAAFEFIKILLSKDLQEKNNFPFFMVNRVAYQEVLKKFSSDSIKESEFGDNVDNNFKLIQYNPLPASLVRYFNDKVKNMQQIHYIDGTIFGIIDMQVERFINGSMTDKETAIAIERSVNDYLRQ